MTARVQAEDIRLVIMLNLHLHLCGCGPPDLWMGVPLKITAVASPNPLLA